MEAHLCSLGQNKLNNKQRQSKITKKCKHYQRLSYCQSTSAAYVARTLGLVSAAIPALSKMQG